MLHYSMLCHLDIINDAFGHLGALVVHVLVQFEETLVLVDMCGLRKNLNTPSIPERMSIFPFWSVSKYESISSFIL